VRGFLNPHVRRDDSFRGLFSDEEYQDVRAYFALAAQGCATRPHPELAPTPLADLRAIAETVGIGAIRAKDETDRFGLNAFKITGARYAVDRLGAEAGAGVVCATAGNHGRAVANAARVHRLDCTVFVPSLKTPNPLELATRNARIAGMREDGATVVEVSGGYEDALRHAASFATDTGATLVSDTSLPPGVPERAPAPLTEQIPRWIMAGYTQVFEEALAQWDTPPTVVIVQGGVGGLVGAAASWFAWRFGRARPFFIAAEPDEAACLLASAEAGHPVTIDSTLETIMAGLRCAEPSAAAWPAVVAGVDAFVTVPDSSSIEAMDLLRSAPDGERLAAGPSGACGLAALVELARDRALENVRSAARLDRSSRALLVITEGP
jgi:diaminopropionate ammonia-lyase